MSILDEHAFNKFDREISDVLNKEIKKYDQIYNQAIGDAIEIVDLFSEGKPTVVSLSLLELKHRLLSLKKPS